jgi:hypothetical protein
MQFKPEQIKRQQMIMRVLGFYSGKIDGIWAQKCIEAKRNWELSGKFNPANPNNGLPFADTDPLPSGMRFDRVSRMFTHRELSETLIAEFSGKSPAPVQSPEPAIVQETPATPDDSTSEVKVVDVGSPAVEKAVQQHKQHQHNHKR